MLNGGPVFDYLNNLAADERNALVFVGYQADGTLGRFAADWGFLLDPLSSVMILVVTGVVLLDRVKNLTRDLNARVGALEHWRDEHISSTQPHAVCILEDRRKLDEHERLERIERKIDRLEDGPRSAAAQLLDDLVAPGEELLPGGGTALRQAIAVRPCRRHCPLVESIYAANRGTFRCGRRC